jgi:hypothetical protein
MAEEYVVFDLKTAEISFVNDIGNFQDTTKYSYRSISEVPFCPIGCVYDIKDGESEKSFFFSEQIYNIQKQYILNTIRLRRNNYLEKTDIYMLQDKTLPNQEELVEYRNYLRNLPNEIENVGFDEYFKISNKRTELIKTFPGLNLN